MDTDDRDDILLSESDEAPSGAAPAAEPTRRGRGRPKGSGAASKRPAGERSERLAGVNEMADVLCKVLGLASTLLAFALVGKDYAGAVALTAQEARDIALPGARLLRKSRLARQASALVSNGGDAIALVTALAGYLLRVGPMVAEIHAQKVGISANGHLATGQVIRPEPQSGQHAASNGHSPANGAASGGGGIAGAGFSDADANAANAFAGWDSPDMAALFREAASY